jgi:hypothetical protein
MSDTGLSNRLRQHTRRSGIVVGLTMAITIVLSIGTSAWIFGQAEPFVADFAGFNEPPEPTPTDAPVVAANDDDEGNTEQSNNNTNAEPQPTQPAAQPTLAAITPTPETEQFEATHASNPNFSVNLRPGPSVGSGDPVAVLEPNSPLLYLDEEGEDDEGLVWLLMETQAGVEGWIREVDTVVVAE